MRELLPYLRLLGRRGGRMAGGALLLLATILSAVGLLSLSGWFITATGVTAMLWAAGLRMPFDIYVPGAGIRFFALARTVSRYFERLVNHDTTLRLLADLRGRVFAVLAGLRPVTLSRLRAGTLLNRLTADIDTLDNLFLRLLAPPAAALAGTLAVCLLLWLFAPAAGLLGLGVLSALWLLVTLAAAILGLPASTARVGLFESLRLRLLEQVQGMAELRAYASLDRHCARIRREEAELQHAQRRAGHIGAGGNALATLAIHWLAVAVLGLGLASHQTGEVSLAVAVLLPMAVIGLGEAFAGLPTAFAEFGATRTAATRLTAELDREQAPAGGPAVVLPRPPNVRVHALAFRYPLADRPLFEHLELAIRPGEHLAITAASGAGKSTLANLILGLQSPDSGTITVGSIDLKAIPAMQLREYSAYLTQCLDLFEDTVAGNLRLAAPGAGEAELWQALHCVALDTWLQSLPAGLDTWIGESGRRISGGQARRLALARLLLRDPSLVVLDEPLAGLDAATAREVAVRLKTRLRDRTVLLLGHSSAALPVAERQLYLENGVLGPG